MTVWAVSKIYTVYSFYKPSRYHIRPMPIILLFEIQLFPFRPQTLPVVSIHHVITHTLQLKKKIINIFTFCQINTTFYNLQHRFNNFTLLHEVIFYGKYSAPQPLTYTNKTGIIPPSSFTSRRFSLLGMTEVKNTSSKNNQQQLRNEFSELDHVLLFFS